MGRFSSPVGEAAAVGAVVVEEETAADLAAEAVVLEAVEPEEIGNESSSISQSAR